LQHIQAIDAVLFPYCSFQPALKGLVDTFGSCRAELTDIEGVIGIQYIIPFLACEALLNVL
jgi:hypothetical protein